MAEPTAEPLPAPAVDLGPVVEREDPLALARAATLDELQRLKAAEELFHLRHQRRSRVASVAAFSQALLGFVAVAGFFANAYQTLENRQQSLRHEAEDEHRWQEEFERAKQADRY